MNLVTYLGMAGVVLVLLAYGLLAAGKLLASGARYQWLNVIGTALILLSLSTQWNLPAFLLNAAWLLIGFAALWRLYATRTHGENE